ncbi:hypothetical protein TRIUR3_17419 [Triticum urartu]|uniref:Uncharacterized protein n=1 Tax=Triticum urartu TaxID=4572 RepID=M7ZYD3_TRIUA|nr:hypothetical protein TRIUR3_17419 [Triticum urartu]
MPVAAARRRKRRRRRRFSDQTQGRGRHATGIYACDHDHTHGLTPLMKMRTLSHEFVPDPIHAGFLELIDGGGARLMIVQFTHILLLNGLDQQGHRSTLGWTYSAARRLPSKYLAISTSTTAPMQRHDLTVREAEELARQHKRSSCDVYLILRGDKEDGMEPPAVEDDEGAQRRPSSVEDDDKEMPTA